MEKKKLNPRNSTKEIQERISKEIEERHKKERRMIEKNNAQFYSFLSSIGFLTPEKIEKHNQIVSDFYDRHLSLRKESSKGKSFLELPFEKILKKRYKNDVENQARLMNFMARVRNDAGVLMVEDEKFASLFIEKNKFDATILSVDIRRSTELMLKCQSPEIYSEFITHLLEGLSSSVKDYYGIYDKFTGDGFLAFFPDFFSGREGLLNAILCSIDCQRIFEEVFGEYKKYFDLSNVKTGLGSGIDFGSVYKAASQMEYSVIGKAVVYACRFSSCPAGRIYLTENAFNKFSLLERNEFEINKSQIDIKHEEPQTAYDIFLKEGEIFENVKACLPDWKLALEKNKS